MRRLIPIIAFFTAGSLAAAAGEKWEASELIGYSLTRVSETAVEAFRFTERGDALAEGGSKERGVAGFVVQWKIDSEGNLRIKWPGKEAVVVKKIKVTGSRYLVEESGVKCEFIRGDWAEYQNSHSKTRK